MTPLAFDPIAATWTISALATLGVILRPFSWPEAIWAVLGAALLIVLGLIAPQVAWTGVVKGLDVYLFLIGMMLLAETARKQGLFDWLAAIATRRARGSPQRLFLLIYGVGVVVTAFLSNDATAVVLTPAVAAAVKTAKVKDPLPYLFICALVANAASFVLPISNPANLVIFGAHMPPLRAWLPRFAIPSALSIAATYAVLRWTQQRALNDDAVAKDVATPKLSANGKLAGAGIGLTAAALLTASALGFQLGAPTAACGVATALAVVVRSRASPWETVKDVSWSVLPLVAGLFVLVEALDRTGLIGWLGAAMRAQEQTSATGLAATAGVATAFASNLVNNLPAALLAANAVSDSGVDTRATSAILVGVDLGPNLSVTGSLATILWLSALRREGLDVGAVKFLKLGVLVMPPALLLAIASLLVP